MSLPGSTPGFFPRTAPGIFSPWKGRSHPWWIKLFRLWIGLSSVAGYSTLYPTVEAGPAIGSLQVAVRESATWTWQVIFCRGRTEPKLLILLLNLKLSLNHIGKVWSVLYTEIVNSILLLKSHCVNQKKPLLHAQSDSSNYAPLAIFRLIFCFVHIFWVRW